MRGTTIRTTRNRGLPAALGRDARPADSSRPGAQNGAFLRAVMVRAGGFTLIENMIAAAVLGVIVLAVGLAVSASIKASQEGQKTVLGSMAADDLMSELRTVPYNTLDTYDGQVQPVGEMQTIAGSAAYPQTYWTIGRSITVEPVQYQNGDLGATINGRRVVIAAFDDRRTLVELEAFIPEPAP